MQGDPSTLRMRCINIYRELEAIAKALPRASRGAVFLLSPLDSIGEVHERDQVTATRKRLNLENTAPNVTFELGDERIIDYVRAKSERAKQHPIDLLIVLDIRHDEASVWETARLGFWRSFFG